MDLFPSHFFIEFFSFFGPDFVIVDSLHTCFSCVHCQDDDKRAMYII